MAVLGDEDVVLGADADAAPLFVDGFFVAGDVEARLDGEDHARFEQARVAVEAVLADIVDIEAQPMPGLVPVETLVAAVGDVFFQCALEQTQRQQTFGQGFHRGDVSGFVGHARLRLHQRRLLRRADQIVQRALLFRETTVDREGAGDVGGVTAILRACVDQHQRAVLRLRVVGAVVQHAGVVAGADDAAVGRLGVVAAEHPLHFRLQFVFVDARLRRAHRRAVRFDADVGGALHQFEFVALLEQPHLIEQMAQFEEFVRRLRAHPHLRADAIEPADQLEVEIGVAAEVVVDAAAAFEQSGQDFVQVVDRIRVVHAEAVDRAFRTGAGAVPAFALQIAFAAEQQAFAVFAAGNQHQHRFGFGKAGEVPEVGILTVRVMRVAAADAFRGRRHHHDGVVAGHPHQLAAAAGIALRGNSRGNRARRSRAR